MSHQSLHRNVTVSAEVDWQDPRWRCDLISALPEALKQQVVAIASLGPHTEFLQMALLPMRAEDVARYQHVALSPKERLFRFVTLATQEQGRTDVVKLNAYTGTMAFTSRSTAEDPSASPVFSTQEKATFLNILQREMPEYPVREWASEGFRLPSIMEMEDVLPEHVLAHSFFSMGDGDRTPSEKAWFESLFPPSGEMWSGDLFCVHPQTGEHLVKTMNWEIREENWSGQSYSRIGADTLLSARLVRPVDVEHRWQEGEPVRDRFVPLPDGTVVDRKTALSWTADVEAYGTWHSLRQQFAQTPAQTVKTQLSGAEQAWVNMLASMLHETICTVTPEVTVESAVKQLREMAQELCEVSPLPSMQTAVERAMDPWWVQLQRVTGSTVSIAQMEEAMYTALSALQQQPTLSARGGLEQAIMPAPEMPERTMKPRR